MRVLFARIVCFMAIILYTCVGATGTVVRGRVIDAVTNELQILVNICFFWFEPKKNTRIGMEIWKKMIRLELI